VSTEVLENRTLECFVEVNVQQPKSIFKSQLQLRRSYRSELRDFEENVVLQNAREYCHDTMSKVLRCFEKTQEERGKNIIRCRRFLDSAVCDTLGLFRKEN